MKISTLANSFLFITLLTGQAFADPNTSLREKRINIINQYLLDLKTGNADDIVQLFEKQGWVISTSKGVVDANAFFHGFLPKIKYAHVELHELFLSPSDADRFAIRFQYHYELKDGNRGKGQYMDEFIFEKNSEKLSSVYMFENLNF